MQNNGPELPSQRSDNEREQRPRAVRSSRRSKPRDPYHRTPEYIRDTARQIARRYPDN